MESAAGLFKKKKLHLDLLFIIKAFGFAPVKVLAKSSLPSLSFHRAGLSYCPSKMTRHQPPSVDSDRNCLAVQTQRTSIKRTVSLGYDNIVLLCNLLGIITALVILSGRWVWWLFGLAQTRPSLIITSNVSSIYVSDSTGSLLSGYQRNQAAF